MYSPLPNTPPSIHLAYEAPRAEMEDESQTRRLPNRLFKMTEPTTSFADSGEVVISQKVVVSPDLSASNLSADEFAEYYDIKRTVDEIVKGDYKRVCLIPFSKASCI
jgi:hypothetical protein